MTRRGLPFLFLLCWIGAGALAAEKDVGRALIRKQQWKEAEGYYASKLVEFAQSKGQKNNEQLANLVLWYDLARHFGEMDAVDAPVLVDWLCKQADFTATLLRAFAPQDSPKRAFHVLAQLRRKFGDDVMKLPGLAIAHAVVWDLEQPFSAKFEAADSFEYYLNNCQRMLLPIAQLPYQAAIYLACAEATPAERQWASGWLLDPRKLSLVYHAPAYDWDALFGKPKRISYHAYTLPNILKYGGICGDRAYYAANVARACGLPAAWIAGPGKRGGHAWTGYLQGIENGRYVWNLGCGRYELDRYYVGAARDPQTGQTVRDYYIAMRTRECGQDAKKARAADCWVCLAGVLEQSSDLDNAQKHDLVKECLEQALKNNRFNLAAWGHICRMCKAGTLGDEYADQIMEAALKTFPDEADFCYGVFASVLETIPAEDTARRIRYYKQAARLFQVRPDLTVGIGRAYGDYLLEMGKEDQAYSIYHETIRTFMDDPRLVVDLAIKVTDRQKEGDDLEKPVALLKALVRRSQKPPYKDPLVRYSAWYRLQVCLRGVYGKIGEKRAEDAAAIETELAKFRGR